jgi:O-antigen/teichoic acid export membrane protein
MPVLAGVLALIAVLIAGAATAGSSTALPWMLREHRRIIGRLTPEQRRRLVVKQVVMYLVVLVWLAVIVWAPFGLRRNLTYFVILPFVVAIPVALLFVGIRAQRDVRRHRP